jgi:acyl dehydratase
VSKREFLNSDPDFASTAGFPKPILHGLCTYGMTCQTMVDTLLDGDVSRVRSYGARFAGVVARRSRRASGKKATASRRSSPRPSATMRSRWQAWRSVGVAS